MMMNINLHSVLDVALFGVIAICCFVAYFRASDIAYHNAKLNREKGYDWLAKNNESKSNIWALKVVFLAGFFMSIYAIYDIILH